MDTKNLSFVGLSGLKNSLDIIFRLIIVQARPIKLQTLFFISFKEISKK